MSVFTIAISCLNTFNLPWFMNLIFQVPMQYWPLPHQTLFLSPDSSTAECCFCFGSVSSFFVELFLHWYPVAYWHPPTWGVHLSVSCLFAFSYCSWGSQGKNTEVVCHSLFQWITFCQTSPPWPVCLGWPYTAWLSFIELDKAVVLWSDWLGFCDCGFSLSALWCPLPAPTVILGFLLPWTWGISSQLLFTLDMGYLLSAATPDLRHGVSSLSRVQLQCRAATALRLGLHISIPGGPGSIPSQGTRSPHATTKSSHAATKDPLCHS